MGYQTTLVVVTHDRRFIMPDDLVLEIQDGQVALENEAIASSSSSPNGPTAEASAGFNGEDSPGRGLSLKAGE